MVTVPLGPAQVDITGIRAGDLNEVRVTLLAAGRPVNLTGKTITAQARTSKTEVTELDAVITITDASNGVLMVRWPGDDVRTWLGTEVIQKGVWDLEIHDGAGDPQTVMAGDFTAELDVTR
jgi:hypothetical protein